MDEKIDDGLLVSFRGFSHQFFLPVYHLSDFITISKARYRLLKQSTLLVAKVVRKTPLLGWFFIFLSSIFFYKKSDQVFINCLFISPTNRKKQVCAILAILRRSVWRVPESISVALPLDQGSSTFFSLMHLCNTLNFRLPCDKITQSLKQLCETRDFYCVSLNCRDILVS